MIAARKLAPTTCEKGYPPPKRGVISNTIGPHSVGIRHNPDFLYALRHYLSDFPDQITNDSQLL